jgi:hypothetical protein
MWCLDLGRDVDIAICFETDCTYSGVCKIFQEREAFEEGAYQAIRHEIEIRRS